VKNEEAIETAVGLWNLFNERKWDEARELLDDDFEATWPQSNEVIKGPDNFIELNRKYPGTHKIQVTDTRHSYDKWDHVDHVITEAFIESTTPEGKEVRLFAISFFEIQEGKIMNAKEFWAETYPAPEWRRHLVEKLPSPEP
jgi:ketosteroid isomerase-like protein